MRDRTGGQRKLEMEHWLKGIDNFYATKAVRAPRFHRLPRAYIEWLWLSINL